MNKSASSIDGVRTANSDGFLLKFLQYKDLPAYVLVET